jgi:hypothetical protein
MIYTVFSSFFFLLPIYLSYVVRDIVGLFMFSIAMGLSIANHSHSFHHNQYRRELFKRMDIWYIHLISIYLAVNAFYIFHYLFVCGLILLNYGIYYQLGSLSIEYYSPYKKKVHVLFHIVGISTFTFIRYHNIFILTINYSINKLVTLYKVLLWINTFYYILVLSTLLLVYYSYHLCIKINHMLYIDNMKYNPILPFHKIK